MTIQKIFFVNYYKLQQDILLPITITLLIIIHLLMLHDEARSRNPPGIKSNSDRVCYHTYLDQRPSFYCTLQSEYIIWFTY